MLFSLSHTQSPHPAADGGGRDCDYHEAIHTRLHTSSTHPQPVLQSLLTSAMPTGDTSACSGTSLGGRGTSLGGSSHPVRRSSGGNRHGISAPSS
jgi:hypothetical protein